MEYNAKSKKLQLTAQDIECASGYFLAAIHYFRESHGLPLEGAKDMRFPDKGQTVEYCILGGAKALGIDLGSERPGELDVREHT